MFNGSYKTERFESQTNRKGKGKERKEKEKKEKKDRKIDIHFVQ